MEEKTLFFAILEKIKFGLFFTMAVIAGVKCPFQFEDERGFMLKTWIKIVFRTLFLTALSGLEMVIGETGVLQRLLSTVITSGKATLG